MQTSSEKVQNQDMEWKQIKDFVKDKLGYSFNDSDECLLDICWRGTSWNKEAEGKNYVCIQGTTVSFVEKNLFPNLKARLAGAFGLKEDKFNKPNIVKTLKELYEESTEFKLDIELKSHFRKLIEHKCNITHFIGIPDKTINILENFVPVKLCRYQTKPEIEVEKDKITKPENEVEKDKTTETENEVEKDKTTETEIEVGKNKIDELHHRLKTFTNNSYNNLHVLISSIPGSGKTTLLKYLALQCSKEQFMKEYIPIFINLADLIYIEQGSNIIKYWELEEFIFHVISRYKIIPYQKIIDIFENGEALIFLDGLEIGNPKDNENILHQVRNFIGKYFHSNFFITCNRFPQESGFDNFTKLEIKRLETPQVKDFVKKWVNNKIKEEQNGESSINKIITNLPDSPPLNAIFTPLLLSFLCLKCFDWNVVHDKNIPYPQTESIELKKKALKKKALEKEALYREALFSMIAHWDNDREHHSSKIYKQLPPRYREDLIGEIAIQSLKSNNLELPLSSLVKLISIYLSPLVLSVNHEQNIENNFMEDILESIEIQDGVIVSQEYNDSYNFMGNQDAELPQDKDKRGKYYKFTHVVVRDYFAALALSRKNWEEWERLFGDNENNKAKWKEIFDQASKLVAYRQRELNNFVTFTNTNKAK